MAARKAEKLGYKNVKVFHAGLPAWKKAGNPLVSTISGLEGLNKADASYILIDLRSKDLTSKGHIPKAIALPKGGIDALKDQFPKHKGAVVILYNQDGSIKAALDSAKKIAGWGYKNVSILAGGFQGWEKAGKTVVKGPAAAKIRYVKKLLPGEFDVEAFKALVKKPSKEILILDVRNASEASANALPDSKNIPLEDLEQRLADLPKGGEVVIHCATGARAEMAYNVLKKLGYKAKYLKAKVEFDKEKKGAYQISE